MQKEPFWQLEWYSVPQLHILCLTCAKVSFKTTSNNLATPSFRRYCKPASLIWMPRSAPRLNCLGAYLATLVH
jgi:hypothetical protein